MFKNNSLQQNSSPRRASKAPGAPKGWLAGMLTGQVVGFAAAVLLAPPAIAFPALVVSTLAGGLIGGMTATRVHKAVQARHFRPVEILPEKVFQALDATDGKLGEMFIEGEFNDVAANNNEPAQEKKHDLAHRMAPAAPRPF